MRYARLTPKNRIGLVDVGCELVEEGTRVSVAYALTALSTDGEAVLAEVSHEVFRADIEGWRDAVVPLIDRAVAARRAAACGLLAGALGVVGWVERRYGLAERPAWRAEADATMLAADARARSLGVTGDDLQGWGARLAHEWDAPCADARDRAGLLALALGEVLGAARKTLEDDPDAAALAAALEAPSVEPETRALADEAVRRWRALLAGVAPILLGRAP